MADVPGAAGAPLPAGRRGLALAVLLAAALLLPFLGRRELGNPDEPRYAEVAREAAAGDWTVVPRLNGEPYVSKPPLFFHMVALSYRLHGEPTDAAALTVPALLGVATAAATWLLGETLLGTGCGLLAALLLVGTPFFHSRTRHCYTDTALTAFGTLAMALFFLAHRRGSWRLALGAGAAAGLAALGKGLHGLAIPAVVVAAWLAARRDGAAFLRLRLWAGLLAGVALVAAWGVALALSTEEGGGLGAVGEFFLGNVRDRFGEEAHHAKPFWFYAGFAWQALPWSLLAAVGAVAALGDRGPVREALLGPLCWLGTGLVAFSLASGKRPLYLLPLYPAAALLAAGTVEAVARATLPGRAGAFARGTLRALEFPALVFWLPRTVDLRRRACAVALAAGLGALAWDAFVESRSNAVESGRVLAARAAEVAGARPLVLFRVGKGDVGLFAFPLRRTLPSAWNEEQLRERAAGRPVVVVAERRQVEESLREGRISPALAAALRPLEDGVAGLTTYTLYAWDGK